LKQKLRDAEAELQKNASPLQQPLTQSGNLHRQAERKFGKIKGTNEKQDKDLKDLQEEEKRCYTEADEHSKQIVEYATNLADLEKRRLEPLKPSKIRTILRKRWWRQKRDRSKNWSKQVHRLAV